MKNTSYIGTIGLIKPILNWLEIGLQGELQLEKIVDFYQSLPYLLVL